ncbi:hypothetical protein [Moorena sp. SIO3H5]|uniref:hypothetical protein n=1 Tax=Moorena sp. SIO3H5 TaxID=2607834 RepID=UPI0013BDA083|nr:hypothetical protein [Moorena sp. SIO3H5]NEO74452.1 hypothetical protein [Moorena sp. SIO3H5]
MGYAHATRTDKGVYIWVVNTRIAEKGNRQQACIQDGKEIRSFIGQENNTIQVYISFGKAITAVSFQLVFW